MMFEPGDAIALKKTAEEGVVVKLLAKKMVLIKINNTEFPVFENEIEHPYFNWFTKKTIVLPKKEKVYIEQIAKENVRTTQVSTAGMHLVLIPVYRNIAIDDTIDKVKIYVSNNQIQPFNFSYYYEGKNGENFEISSEVLPRCDFYVHDITYEQLASNPYWELSFTEIITTFTNKEVFTHEEQLVLKPKKLLAVLEDLHQNNKPFITFLLFNNTPHLQHAPIAEVKAYNPAQPIVQAKQKAKEKTILDVPKATTPQPVFVDKTNWTSIFANPFEIDLHIEKLRPADHMNMPMDEKLNFQLTVVEKALDNAIVNAQQSMVIIHGIGKGALKQRINAILSQTKQVSAFVNEYKPKFGWGSTEIWFNFQ